MTPDWGLLVKDSLTRPREAAKTVLTYSLRSSALVQAAGLVSVVSSILLALTIVPADDVTQQMFPALLQNPLAMALAQFLFLFVLAQLVHGVGRMAGGTGELRGAVMLMIWFQIMICGFQVLQMVITLVAPILLAPFMLAFLFWYFWGFSAFIAELHGFRSKLMVFAGLLVTLVVISIALGLVLALLGVQPVDLER